MCNLRRCAICRSYVVMKAPRFPQLPQTVLPSFSSLFWFISLSLNVHCFSSRSSCFQCTSSRNTVTLCAPDPKTFARLATSWSIYVESDISPRSWQRPGTELKGESSTWIPPGGVVMLMLLKHLSGKWQYAPCYVCSVIVLFYSVVWLLLVFLSTCPGTTYAYQLPANLVQKLLLYLQKYNNKMKKQNNTFLLLLTSAI